MSLFLQPATQRDLGFVMSLAQNGARHGHFDSRITSDKSAYLAYLQQAVRTGRDPRGYETSVSVVMVDAHRVGATVVTEAIGTPDIGVEIAMISVKPEYRGRGLGRQILDELIDKYLSTRSVYARCLPASKHLHDMLLRRDFFEVGMSQQSVILRHPPVGGFVGEKNAPITRFSNSLSA
jgi:GNAT superfamily N-acetyltransferase